MLHLGDAAGASNSGTNEFPEADRVAQAVHAFFPLVEIAVGILAQFTEIAALTKPQQTGALGRGYGGGCRRADAGYHSGGRRQELAHDGNTRHAADSTADGTDTLADGAPDPPDGFPETYRIAQAVESNIPLVEIAVGPLPQFPYVITDAEIFFRVHSLPPT